LSQAELARQLGIKPPHANNLEAGRRAPSIALVLKVADLLGVRTDYLLRDGVPVEDVAQYEDRVPASSGAAPQLLGHKLRALRLSRGWTQGDVAHQLGLTVSFTHKLCCDRQQRAIVGGSSAARRAVWGDDRLPFTRSDT